MFLRALVLLAPSVLYILHNTDSATG